MAEGKLVLERPGEVVVRMYGQGFGDCFLLALPRAGEEPEDLENPVYVVIDCGVFFQTPGEAKRMRAVVENLRRATGGVIDLLVATHEHYDHLCGFKHAAKEWKEIEVRTVWVAWTEDPNNEFTKRYDREVGLMEEQFSLVERVIRGRAGADDALAAEWQQLARLAGFGGDDPAADEEQMRAAPSGAGEAPFPPPRKLSKGPDRILDAIAHAPEKLFREDGAPARRDFCRPGHVKTVPGSQVDAYVLGPPTNVELLKLDSRESEVFHLMAQGATLDDVLSAAGRQAAGDTLNATLRVHADPVAAYDPYAPFRPSLRISYEDARKDPYFREQYFGLAGTEQIENDWLRGAGGLALQIDNVVNNTSLVLALRLPDGRVLLFVGDAQVGNWLSWLEIKPEDWKRPEGGAVELRPTAAELLAKTALYKVGHHGSHNATLQAKGVELMPDGLIAFVPTSRAVPQENYEPAWEIPLPSLMRRLREKCRGQVVLPYDNEYASDAFAAGLQMSKEKLEAMERKGKDGKIEIKQESVALWRQVRI